MVRTHWTGGAHSFASALRLLATAAGSGPTGSGTGGVSAVSSSGGTCSVTLAGTGSRVHVLGTTVGFAGIRDGVATLRVGGRTVSLTRGRPVVADGVELTCTEVSRDTVRFTVVPA
jgi:hypothetical protein